MSEWYYYQADIEKLEPETVLVLIRWCNEQDKYTWDDGNNKLVESDITFKYDITVGNRRIKNDNTALHEHNFIHIHITNKHLECFREVKRLEKLRAHVSSKWLLRLRWDLLEKKLNKKRKKCLELPSMGAWADPYGFHLLKMMFCFHFTEEEFCQESKEVQTMLKEHLQDIEKGKIYRVGAYNIFVSLHAITIEPLYRDELLAHSKKTISAFRQLCEEIKPIRGFIAHTTDNEPIKIVFP